MLWLFALACGTDPHALLSPPLVQAEVPPEDPVQDIAFEPAELDLGLVCQPTLTELEVENAGTATLQLVSIAVRGDGWDVDLAGVPGQLAPGERATLPLHTAGGVAFLEVSSDDPDESFVTVPLKADNMACPPPADTGDTGWDTGDTGL